MRFIDIDDLQVPVGWQVRAEQALVALRTEITQAQAGAQAAGLDVPAARKTAIRAGLTIAARENLWRELAPWLAALGHGKCWYSESRNPASDKNVDHFRPKLRVEEDVTHEGYWWLAFASRNFRFASQWCNQRRVDRVNDTSGGKADHFPLRPHSFLARIEADDYEQEDVELLDPTHPEDWRLLTFTPNGYPTPSRPPGTPDYERAAKSIEVYHLSCKELVDERRPLAGRIQRLVGEMERLLPKIPADLRARAFYMRQEVELLKLIRKEADYSAAALAYARGEVYTERQGHQVKRQWLEDILNANP